MLLKVLFHSRKRNPKRKDQFIELKQKQEAWEN